jgi:eukaryotic-like serine/threonine-protein kinase
MTENQLLGDRYRLVRLLAVGGMGEGWEATDELLARSVAVKLLRPEHVSDETARRRFRAEARFAGSLQHSGIAQVYDYGEHNEKVFLVMELVSGETLSDLLEHRGALGPDITLGIVAQAARALQAAHTAGIVHRDIKPGNLMVTDDDIIKITDFGIARDGDLQSSYTATGMVMGTAHYVSPEQATARKVTGSSDLYSLGVVAFQCLTGELPFDGDTAVAVALQHVHDPPPPLPPEIPEPVRAFIERLMDKEPARRPASAQEVAEIASSLRASIVFGMSGPHPAVPTPASGHPAVRPPTGPTGQVEPPGRGPWEPATEVQPVAMAGPGGPVGPGDDGGGGQGAWDGPLDDDEFVDLYGPRAAASARGQERRRGSVLVLTLVGAAILVLGVIMLSSIWQGSNRARFVDDYRPGSVPTQEFTPDLPIGERATPTPKASKATPSERVIRTPTARETPRPRPTRPSPRPTRPTPTKSTPDPSESPSPSPSVTGPDD